MRHSELTTTLRDAQFAVGNLCRECRSVPAGLVPVAELERLQKDLALTVDTVTSRLAAGERR